MKRIIFVLISIVLHGCGGDEVMQLEHNFAETYQLSDFNLPENYDYWEIRQTWPSLEEEEPYDVITQYDENAYNNLDATQKQLLEDVTSQNGFAAYCFPGYCPYYAVAIEGYNVTIVETRSQLLDFFGAIDTEAELAVFMDYDQSYRPITEPLSYRPTDYGYMVVLAWDTTCGLRGKDLVKVHRDGTVQKIRQLSKTEYNGCA